jgi:hypothetical protein
MRRDEIMAEEDKKMLADKEVAMLLASKRRNIPLGFAEVKKLVQALQLGMARQANLEKYASLWRLRFSLFDASGGKRRRSIVIEDAETMEWVRDFLAEARPKRSQYRSDLDFQAINEYWRKREEEEGTGCELLDLMSRPAESHERRRSWR